MMMALLDSQGAKRRRRRQLKWRVYQNKVWMIMHELVLFVKQGPDFVWHLDGYDKLKSYGFAIHGCIDGLALHPMHENEYNVYRYSRKVIWLKVMTTNNDSNVCLLPYLLSVLKNNGSYYILGKALYPLSLQDAQVLLDQIMEQKILLWLHVIWLYVMNTMMNLMEKGVSGLGLQQQIQLS